MRIVVAPDSFKGSLTSADAGALIAGALARAGHDAVVVPVADGGEGTVDAFLRAAGGERRTTRVAGPYGAPVGADWAMLPGGTAVVELAAAAGLPLVGSDRRTEDASTFGLGELILAAARAGARRIVVGLGGSACTDGGCGAAAACGAVFTGHDGEAFVPTGATLARVAGVDLSRRDPSLAGVRMEALRDVDNPLTGASGAAAVFGPQKGAGPEVVRALDAGLAHLAAVIARDLGIDVERIPGGGAAGGTGAGLVAFLGAALVPGADAVLDAAGFDALLADADAVVTGEGSLDLQTFSGKAVAVIARRAARAGAPVHVLAGRVDGAVRGDLAGHGIASARAVTPEGTDEAEALGRAREFLATAAEILAAELGS